MKKIIASLLILIALLALFGCTNEKQQAGDSSSSPGESTKAPENSDKDSENTSASNADDTTSGGDTSADDPEDTTSAENPDITTAFPDDSTAPGEETTADPKLDLVNISGSNWVEMIKKVFGFEVALPDGVTVIAARHDSGNVEVAFSAGNSYNDGKKFAKNLFDSVKNIAKDGKIYLFISSDKAADNVEDALISEADTSFQYAWTYADSNGTNHAVTINNPTNEVVVFTIS